MNKYLINLLLLAFFVPISQSVNDHNDLDLDLKLSPPGQPIVVQSNVIDSQSALPDHISSSEMPQFDNSDKRITGKKRRKTKTEMMNIDRAAHRRKQYRDASRRFRQKTKANPEAAENYRKRKRVYNLTYIEKAAQDPKKVAKRKEKEKKRTIERRLNRKKQRLMNQNPE